MCDIERIGRLVKPGLVPKNLEKFLSRTKGHWVQTIIPPNFIEKYHEKSIVSKNVDPPTTNRGEN